MEFIEKLYHDSSVGDLHLYCCGRRLDAPGHRFGPSNRDHFWLIFMKEGSGFYETGGTQYRLEKGNLFIAYPNRKIRYYADPGSVWSIYWVSIGAPNLETYLHSMGIDESEPVLTVRAPLAMEHTFEALLEFIPDETISSRFECTSLLYKLLSLIVPVDQSPRNNRDYVSEAIFFMTNHSSEAITAQDIANTIGLDVSYFSRIFKKKTGMRPIGWLNRYRLDQAQRLLSETDMKIKEIAEAVGFADPLYFTRRFTECYGIPPKDWRKTQMRTSLCGMEKRKH